MLPHEKEKFDQIDCNFGSKYWLPVQWALSIVHSSRRDRLIDSDYYCERICEVLFILQLWYFIAKFNQIHFQEIRCFRNNLANLCKFDWVPLPLAYPQLVYLAIHVHFLIILISKQEIVPSMVESNVTEMPSTAEIVSKWFISVSFSISRQIPAKKGEMI